MAYGRTYVQLLISLDWKRYLIRAMILEQCLSETVMMKERRQKLTKDFPCNSFKSALNTDPKAPKPPLPPPFLRPLVDGTGPGTP